MGDNAVRDRSESIPGRVFWLDGRGGMKDITGEDRASRQTGFVLVALEPQDTDCLDWLTGEFGGVAAAAMMDHEARPHCTVHEDGALIALIADPPAMKEAHAKSTPHNARFWIEKGR
jgi:hypothetical protein